MPTYEYVCTKCGQHVEAVQSFSDPPLTTCAQCGGSLRKVFGNIGIVLKGSGFYKNDSRTEGPKKSAAAESGAPAPAAASSAGTGSATSSPSSDTAASGNGKAAANGSASGAGTASSSGGAPAPASSGSS